MDKTISYITDKTVTITREYFEKLRKDEDFLSALKGAGVDNWQGYDFAWELYNEERGEIC